MALHVAQKYRDSGNHLNAGKSGLWARSSRNEATSRQKPRDHANVDLGASWSSGQERLFETRNAMLHSELGNLAVADESTETTARLLNPHTMHCEPSAHS